MSMVMPSQVGILSLKIASKCSDEMDAQLRPACRPGMFREDSRFG
jgi:hypothetical protein